MLAAVAESPKETKEAERRALTATHKFFTRIKALVDAESLFISTV
ncbi:hypothetical protein ELBR111191_20620 [Elizabethkingia bruuniana]